MRLPKNISGYPRYLKVTIVIGIIVAGSIAWWLGSPLFLEGETGDENFSGIVDDNNNNILFKGNFVKMDETHKGEGEFRILRDQEGDIRLYFIDVNIANGPALVIYLSSKSSFSSIYEEPGDYISLGDLPKNKGNFSVRIPETTDLQSYNSVLIWCEPFEVVFTYAMFQQ